MDLPPPTSGVAARLLRVVVLGGCLLAAWGPGAVAWADEAQDLDIAERVERALAPLQRVSDLEVTVSGGVVVITGTASDDEARARVVEIARKVEGVLDVESRLTPPGDVGGRIAPALERVRDLGLRVWRALPLFGVALLLLIAAWVFSRLVTRWDWLFRRLTRNRFTRDIARQFTRVTIVVLGLVLALEVLDATALVGAILGAAGLAGLAIGLAFRDLFENYLASVLLGMRRPFDAGDHVRIGPDEGLVVALTTRSTRLRTLDGNQLRILNTDVYKSRIINYTSDPNRRFEFSVGVGVDEDLAAARRLGTETLQGIDGVLDEPSPHVVLHELGESSVELRHYAWVDQREVDFLKTRGEAIRLVKQAYDRAGYDMPEPIQRIRIERASAVPAPAVDEPTRAIDITPEVSQDREVARERAELGDEDLLASDG